MSIAANSKGTQVYKSLIFLRTILCNYVITSLREVRAWLITSSVASTRLSRLTAQRCYTKRSQPAIDCECVDTVIHGDVAIVHDGDFA